MNATAESASRDRHAQTLHRVALAAARPSSPTLFDDLVGEMAESLGAAAGLVAVFTDDTQERVRTAASLLDGKRLTPFEYAIAGTPCEQVVGSEFRHVVSGLAVEFQASSLFAAKGMDSYAAFPLCDSHGERLGLLAVMDRAPLADVDLAEAVLKIIGSRIAAELERSATEGVLRTAALAVSGALGGSVFAELARSLAQILRVDVTFIARPDDADPGTMKVLAMQFDGASVEGGSYVLAGTPCEGVMRNGFRVVPERAAVLFPGDGTLTANGIEGYAGYPLTDRSGTTLGLVSIASRAPLRRWDRIESLMQIFAVRAAAEIERLRSEDAVRRSEESYRTIFEAIEDGVVIHDWDTGALVDLNPKACAVSGFRREDVLGAPLSIFCARDAPYSEADARRYLQLARDGYCPPYEWRGRRPDRSVAWYEVRLKAVEIGGVPRILSLSRDITEKKNAEEALRLREEQYRAIFEASSDAFVLRDANLEVVDVNPAFLQLYGFTREQLAARGGYPETFPTGYVAERRERVERALQGEESRIETIALRPDGTSFEADLRVIPVRYRGEPHVLSVVRDITERRQRERELQRSEARLRATVEAAFDCIIGMDGEGRIVEFNAAAERCFGHARSAVLGRLLADVIIPQRLRHGHTHGLKRFGDTGHGPFIGRLVETAAIRADGSEFPVELAISVAAAPDGNIYVGHLRDITERRRAELQQAELESQLRQAQKMEAIGQLTGGIAHDFNNILTSVTGYVALASDGAQRLGAGDIVRQLGQAHLAAQRARDLISQMLAFARRQRSERRPLLLAGELRQSAQLLRSTLPSSVELHTSLDAAAPAVIGDSVQIEQVVFNLCINARDAIRGAGAIRIDLAAASIEDSCASCRAPLRGRWVVISVDDNGSGVDDAVRERMFEPFYTTKPVGSGSGMGLAMVHGIVHDHGGHLLVDPVEPHGTRFRVLLPPASTLPAPAIESGRDELPSARLAGRILLVEDEAMVGAFMAELLGGWGFEVTHCADPLEVEARLAHGAFDVVLTDQTMPGLTGLELAARCHAARPDLPVLLYSGFGEGIDVDRLTGSRVRALLRKPIEPHALRSALAEALAVRA
ncbi:MAG TPA: PAS domain S-box protein [Caldimonas sp.]|nr:PAS domain S-box protein [Caldimonas sp.]